MTLQAELEAQAAFKLAPGRVKSMMKGWDASKKKDKGKKAGPQAGAAAERPKEALDELASLSMPDEGEGDSPLPVRLFRRERASERERERESERARERERRELA